jgi:peroxiredoxin 2/4
VILLVTIEKICILLVINLIIGEFMSVLVGKQAPDFTAAAVMGDGSIVEKFNMSAHLKGKVGILFFWPLDFTFVCPSEIIAFNNRFDEFRSRGAEVIGVSVDSQFTHLAWRNTPVDKGGIGEVKFPMVADLTKNIARDYDVLVNDAVAFRGTFMIDKKGVVRHQLVNDLPLGRNVDEALRMLDALNFHEENGEVCPAGWSRGEDGMKPSAAGVASYLGKHAAKL